MIIVRLIGGLGNQMFQYAAAKSLAIKNDVELILDLSYLEQKSSETYTQRNFALNYFNINTRTIKNNEFEYLYNTTFLNKIKKRLTNYIYYHDYSLSYHPIFLKLKDKTYLEGYFQSEKYFKSIETQLINEFNIIYEIHNIPLINNVKGTESVAIHFRRGDFSNKKIVNERHGTCTIEYYASAIKLVSEVSSNPLCFFVFSDDIPWAKEQLSGFNSDFTFVEHTGDNASLKDFILMKNCKHQIIANSTFSWWAAWLNQNNNKVVIAPKKWLNDKTIDTADIIPESWRTI